MKKVLLPILVLLLTLSFLPLTTSAQVQQRNISVSAVIPPQASDYEFAFADDGQTIVPQRTVLQYTITYGVRDGMNYDDPITIVARFDDDLAPDNSHVTAYVPGSASNAYGGAVPVVDLINRKITWTITKLPEGTHNQVITFQLKTTENYSGFTPVDFTTKAQMSNLYVSLPEESVTQTYQFDPALVTPTPTPTPGPTATPGPGPTATPGPPAATPTPTPELNQFKITNVSINELTANSATIGIGTNKAARSYLRYGTSPTNLGSVTAPSKYAFYSTTTIDKLTPATQYYFQVVSADAQGKILYSEIYTFTTAKQSTQSTAGKGAVSISSSGIVLASALLNEDEKGNLFTLLPTDTNYQLTYTYTSDPSFKTSDVIVRNAAGDEQVVHLNSQGNLIYAAALQSKTSGMFTILIRRTDASGNLREQQIGRLKVVTPLTVLEKGSHQPLGDARVLLSLFNPAWGNFRVLAEDFFPGLKNPSFTDAIGTDKLLLPPGRYQVEVSAFGHRPETVTFTLGDQPGQEYPIVYLESDPLNLSALFTFLRDWFNDVINTLQQLSANLMHSSRLFGIVATIITSGFILLSYLLFSMRTDMKITRLLLFFFFFLAVMRKRHKEEYISGRVCGLDKQPLSRVRIDILDPKTHTILMHTDTNAAGTFHIRNRFKTTVILLLVTKDGYVPNELPLDTTRKGPITIILQHKGHTPAVVYELQHLAGSLFEVSLLFSLILELIFFATFGAVSTLPFLVLSLLNIILWLFYLEEHTKI